MLVTTIMVVLSVQISVNLSVLKGWGLHPLDELATLAEVMDQFKRGEIEGCSSFVFPDALLEQPFECYIAPNLSGPFQTVFRCARVGEIHAFGLYLKFVITPNDQPAEQTDIVSRVFIRANLVRTDAVETAYYSSGVFDDVCVHCGDPNDIVKGEDGADIMPTFRGCRGCFNDQTKPSLQTVKQ